MTKKNVSPKRHAKKAVSSSRSGSAKSNVERKNSSSSLEKRSSHSQQGFSEGHGERSGSMDYNDTTIGVP